MTEADPQDPNDPQDPENAPETPPDEISGLRSEASKWRRALREAEKERDALRARLDLVDRERVEAKAAAVLSDPADLFLASSLDGMRGEDGEIDDERVAAELERVAEEHPSWKAAPTPNPELHPGAREPVPAPGPDFGDLLKQAGRR